MQRFKLVNRGFTLHLSCWLLRVILLLANALTAFAQQPMRGLTSPRPGSFASERNPQPIRQAVAARPASSQFSDSSFFDASIGYSAAGDSLQPIPFEGIYPSDSGLGCEDCGATLGSCFCQPFGWLLDWSRAELWLGTSSFTGASNYLNAGAGNNGQVEGNFGFQEGFNFGSRLPSLLGGQIGSQIGMRFTQSQLDGSTAGRDNRTQAFITAGLFRRVDFGLQGGLVVDYLHDDWVYKADLLQLRGELSFLFTPCHDFGFRFTDSQQTDDTEATLAGLPTPLPLTLTALNAYRFFYRYRFGPTAGGIAELQAGFTEDSGAILGIDLKAPLQNQLGLGVNATYLLPPSQAAVPFAQEGWNIGLSLIWTPGRVFGTQRDYYRPLLDVAHNGSFLSRLQ